MPSRTFILIGLQPLLPEHSADPVIQPRGEDAPSSAPGCGLVRNARSQLTGPSILSDVHRLTCGAHGSLDLADPTNPSVLPPASTKNPTICPRSLTPLIVVVPTPSGSSTDWKRPSSKMNP